MKRHARALHASRRSVPGLPEHTTPLPPPMPHVRVGPAEQGADEAQGQEGGAGGARQQLQPAHAGALLLAGAQTTPACGGLREQPHSTPDRGPCRRSPVACCMIVPAVLHLAYCCLQGVALWPSRCRWLRTCTPASLGRTLTASCQVRLLPWCAHACPLSLSCSGWRLLQACSTAQRMPLGADGWAQQRM